CVWHLLPEVLKQVQHDEVVVQHDGVIRHPEFVILNLFQDLMRVALVVLMRVALVVFMRVALVA
ncbi:MAG: hypothetical protein GY928_36805, partial [Colwellia sp.]|nr:hypothetical protein [Colwellia sp.]